MISTKTTKGEDMKPIMPIKLKDILPERTSKADWLISPTIHNLTYLDGLVEGWNACRDKIKQKLQPQ